MSGIEFIDEPDEPGTASPPGPGDATSEHGPAGAHAEPSRLQAAVTAASFAAAAAFSVVAATGRLYTIGFGPGGRQFPYGVDASGAYHGIGEAAVEGARGPHYAWALLGCAVVLAALAVQVAASLLRLRVARRFAPAVTYVAIGVTGVLGGVTLAAYLGVSAVLDSARTSTLVGAQEGDPVRADISTRFGSGLWLAVASLACAALGVGAATALHRLRVTRRAGRSPGR